MPKIADRVLSKIERAGISAKRIIIPAVIVVVCMHAMIVINTIHINRIGQSISEVMQLNFTYAQTLKTYESMCSGASDKAQLYVSTGDEALLDEYCRRFDALAEQEAAVDALLSATPFGPAVSEIQSAKAAVMSITHIEAVALRLCAQSHQVSLIRYPLLAETEISAEERKQSAQAMLSGSAYKLSRGMLNDSMDNAMEQVSKYTSQTVGRQSVSLAKYRALQWVMTLLIITILLLMCLLLFTRLLTPLELSVKQIQRGEALPAERGLLEFRRLANSYNELLHHRKMMEAYLRQQSQTDALTKLSNRLAFQNFISDLSWKRAHSAVTVFSLDVNGLKDANDSRGHAYGDELLRNCAACIRETFGEEGDRQCFRFGGDEFAAFWVDVPFSEIEGTLRRFAEAQKERDISISVGYAHADDLSKTTVEELFERADKFMYEEKAKHYKETSSTPRNEA